MYDRNDKLDAESTATGGDSDERCSVCKAAIDTTEWYPIRGRSDNGNFRLYTFCSTDCFETWESAEPNETE